MPSAQLSLLAHFHRASPKAEMGREKEKAAGCAGFKMHAGVLCGYRQRQGGGALT